MGSTDALSTVGKTKFLMLADEVQDGLGLLGFQWMGVWEHNMPWVIMA